MMAPNRDKPFAVKHNDKNEMTTAERASFLRKRTISVSASKRKKVPVTLPSVKSFEN